MKMPMDTIQNKQYGRVCVLGWGITGQAVTEYLYPLLGNRVEEMTVYTGRVKKDGIDEKQLHWKKLFMQP